MKKLKNNQILMILAASLSLLSLPNTSTANALRGGSNAGFITSSSAQEPLHQVDNFMVTRPVPNRISSYVQPMRCLVKNGEKVCRGHKGTDFASPTGTPIKAVADGVLVFNTINGGGINKGFGMYSGVSHADGYKTLYAHLSKFALPPNTPVKAGDVIGWSGNTGSGTGAHLHYEVKKNNIIVNTFPNGQDLLDYGSELPRMEHVEMEGYTNPMPNVQPITTFDCGTVEISNYMTQLNYKNPKGMSNIPAVFEFEPAVLKSKEIEYGKEATECLTIFNDGTYEEMVDKVTDVWEGLTGLFDNPMGGISKITGMATEKAKELYKNLEGEFKKGICQRLSKDAVKDMIGNQIQVSFEEHAKATSSRGSSNSAAVRDFAESLVSNNLIPNKKMTYDDMAAKHFTYLLIQGQIKKGGKEINNVLQMNPEQFGEYIGGLGVEIMDDLFKEIEGEIFGN